ncbi:MAG TPA: hypothetical protein EYN91_14080 [Candidatus Melainabacteria bacterium]|jgi:hypothetical protein|nr:hypothetical protein [Candidatus Melainabacteria bacterium]HIN67451.1 hypothetical protein [Candidatus Obscuribacterales bacterium]
MSTSGLFGKSMNAYLLLGAVALVNFAALPQGAAAEPFKLGAEQKQFNEDSSYPAYPQYPTPQAMPAPRPPMRGNVQQDAPRRPMNAGVQQDAPPRRPPINAGIQQRVVLPASFLGSWNVSGQRTKVEALPEFQAGAEAVFAPNTNNVWNIGGDPNSGYSMSNDQGVSTQLVVDKVEGNTAFIRYQHPIKNTVAGEAIVMSLVPGGAQFNGLERVSITKQGQVRAKVTYQLVGRRGR